MLTTACIQDHHAPSASPDGPAPSEPSSSSTCAATSPSSSELATPASLPPLSASSSDCASSSAASAMHGPLSKAVCKGSNAVQRACVYKCKQQSVQVHYLEDHSCWSCGWVSRLTVLQHLDDHRRAGLRASWLPVGRRPVLTLVCCVVERQSLALATPRLPREPSLPPLHLHSAGLRCCP